MKLTPRMAPHIRSSVSNKTVMGDIVIILLAVYVMAWFCYGLRAIIQGILSIGICWLVDILCVLWRGRNINCFDFSPIVTGLMIPLLLPASVEYGIVIVAGVFAICVVKQAFGGLGSNLFNPAAGGLCFVITCWSDRVFAYPSPFSILSLMDPASQRLFSGTAATLNRGGTPPYDVTSMLLGLAPGPMGTANIVILGACLLYLCFRGTIRLWQPMIFLITAAIWAAFFPRISAGLLSSIFYEFTGTPILFGVTFFLSDPVTTPRRREAKMVYAFISALVVMLFQWYGGYEITFPFALLICNAFVPILDSTAEEYIRKKRRRQYGRQWQANLTEERNEINAVQ